MSINCVIRCDAATLPEIGTGHVVRSIHLANGLINKGVFKKAQVSFATQSHGPYAYGAELLTDSGFAVHAADEGDLVPNSPAESEMLKALSPTLLIIDRLSTDETLIKEMKNQGIRVVSFDDTGDGAGLTDLTINALLQAIPIGQHILTGLQYLNLGPCQSIEPAPIRETVKQVCITFGGYDERDLTRFVLKALQQVSDFKCRLDIIIGRLNKVTHLALLELIDSFKGKTQCRATLYQRPDNYYDMIALADLAIVSGGLTMFETVLRGIPTIVLPQYAHQLNNAKALGDAIMLGSEEMECSEANFLKVFRGCIASYEKRCCLACVARNSLDGQGLERIIDALIERELTNGA